MIKVSDNAKQKINSILTEENTAEDSFVRVGVKGGGCSGLMYNLEGFVFINPNANRTCGCGESFAV